MSLGELVVLASLASSALAACPFGHVNLSPEEHEAVHRGLRYDVFREDDIGAYNDQTKEEKFSYLRQKIDSTPDSAPYPSTIELAGLLTESMGVTVNTEADEFPQSYFFQRKKLIHSRGYIAEAKIEMLSNPYTGLFQGASKAFIRASTAAQPDYSKTNAKDGGFGPGISLKVLRDGAPSGNIVSLNQLSPVSTWNFFGVPITNHLPQDNLTTAEKIGAAKFETAPTKWAAYTGLSQWARYSENGDEETDASINFPFQIIFYPDAALSTRFPDSGTNLDVFTTQLSQLPVGQHLYEIWTKDTYDSPAVHIGDISMASPFVPSAYGDQTFFVQHQVFEEDIKLRPDMLNSCTDAYTCPVCPTELSCK